ncbi:hypothetical protein [uncultured Chryseobacterium sp.]|uniref:hypothetical protein n=1 Tax=uncultured Chryseobacterium sp. TaxID=259322 RepID=UPI002586E545|nr:hypothetical protein [uncultured Chryseobacterium sp.]
MISKEEANQLQKLITPAAIARPDAAFLLYKENITNSSRKEKLLAILFVIQAAANGVKWTKKIL